MTRREAEETCATLKREGWARALPWWSRDDNQWRVDAWPTVVHMASVEERDALRRARKNGRGIPRWLDEALNSGDGSYKP